MYTCEKCNYETAIKSNYTKHLKTNKHKLNGIVCDNCEKSYKTRQSLWKHKQECTNNLLIQLLQQTKELKQTQIIQNIQNVQNIQTFNLNIFLNETCKDALNINEFVDSLKVQECDIIETGQIGFVNGISKIFIRGLEELELHKRPIHCSDIKRETIYIKDDDFWENDHKILNRAINTLTIKNTSKILDWQKKNPEWIDKKNDQYLSIVSNNFGDSELQCKIIKRLAKNTMIQKLDSQKL
uniref:C2H2-type domain-containing protein n=1 Tax=viral metagenome TaxID=1070528 RepID=A0A6C0HSC8_9ZZZZ